MSILNAIRDHALSLMLVVMALVPLVSPPRDLSVRARATAVIFFLTMAAIVHWLIPVCYVQAWMHTFIGLPIDSVCL